MGRRKGDQQQAHGHHQPCFVCVPEGPDRGDHPVLFGLCAKGREDTHAQIEPVQHHIDQDRQPHQRGKNHGQPDGGITKERHHDGHSAGMDWIAPLIGRPASGADAPLALRRAR